MNRCTSPVARTVMRAGALIVMVALAQGPMGCAWSKKPRNYWWQFWRTPQTVETGLTPDTLTNVIPPPVTESTGSGTPLPVPPTPVPVTVTEPEPIRTAATTVVSALQMVHFDYDSADLTPEAQRILDENARWLLANPGLSILIEGHCDERGSVEYNFNLGERRANSVRAYLISKGVPAERLHTISYGKERPLDPASTPEAWAKNRRVQFFVY